MNSGYPLPFVDMTERLSATCPLFADMTERLSATCPHAPTYPSMSGCPLPFARMTERLSATTYTADCLEWAYAITAHRWVFAMAKDAVFHFSRI